VAGRERHEPGGVTASKAGILADIDLEEPLLTGELRTEVESHGELAVDHHHVIGAKR